MENLAGNKNCDVQIERELIRSGIEIIRLDKKLEREVPASITGRLGPFVFARAWYYWIAIGPMPLEIAKKLFQDPVGREDIRVAGHCGCPAPESPFITWRTPDGRMVAPVKEEASFNGLIAKGHLGPKEKAKFIFSDNPTSVGASAFVTSYHIDTEVGLRLFADTIRKHGLQ